MKNEFRMKFLSGTMCFVLIASALPIDALADAPPGLRDLVDIRANYGEDELKSRGYHLEDSDTSGDSKYTTWWNGDERKCVMVETYDGRYKNLQSVGASNCNQEDRSYNSNNDNRYRNNYNNYDNHNNDHKSSGAAGAVVAALAIGAVVAAAVASSKNKDKDRSGSYSPSNDITCYRSSRSCYGPYNDGYNGYWTNREFPRY